MNLTVKTVCVFEGNLQRGLPNHLALITLFDRVIATNSTSMLIRKPASGVLHARHSRTEG